MKRLLLPWVVLFGFAAYDLLLPIYKFAGMHRLIRGWQVPSKKVSQDFIDSVCVAVNSAMMWYPKQVLCLQRSVVTTCLLRSHGVQAHMVMGAQRTPFKAHAWVEVDGRAINEKTDVQAHYGIWVRC
jgi:hypothetical protein